MLKTSSPRAFHIFIEHGADGVSRVIMPLFGFGKRPIVKSIVSVTPVQLLTCCDMLIDPVQPALSVPVTLYTEVTDGVTETELPFTELNQV